MPNYVYSDLHITGDKKELAKFKEFAKGKKTYYDKEKVKEVEQILDMGKFIPYPKKFDDIDKENKKIYDFYDAVSEKVKKGDKLTAKEKKIANEMALCELEDKTINPSFKPWYPSLTDGYNGGGYEWCCENWGTNWNFGDVALEEEGQITGHSLHYSFNTAWSIPYPVLLKMSKMFPKLKFDYYGNEESEEFEIELTLEKGEITSEEKKDWNSIQIEKIQEGNLDDFDGDKIQEELKLHTGHNIEYNGNGKGKGFICKTCNDKLIWEMKD